MTAIAVVYTKEGLVIAADGRSRLSEDPTQGIDTQQKIFHSRAGDVEIAWALSGSVFNKDKSFSLIAEIQASIDATNALVPKPAGCSGWLDVFASNVRKRVMDARHKEIIPPFTTRLNEPNQAEENMFATVFIVGNFCGGRPSSARVIIAHNNGELLDPPPIVLNAATFAVDKHNTYYGSIEVALRYHNHNGDKQFLSYFRQSGHTLNEGLAHARGYIEACSSDLAREIDPVICNGIGGHIHAAAITRDGAFRWLIEPIENATF